MFEKITNAAETLATSVAESRRGFLARLGKLALGAAGVVGGLLVLPSEAKAQGRQGYCRVIPAVPPSRAGRGHAAYLDGQCVSANAGNCILGQNAQCPSGARPQSSTYSTCSYACQFGTCFGLFFDRTRPCTF
jgi:hypothetical protein